MPEVQEALQSLRDVDGVLGSFVLDEHGQVCARDMPRWLDDAALEEAGGRLSRMRAAIASVTQDVTFDGATARFGGHLLLMRPVGGASLCVLCPTNTRLATLQMGVSLVARRLLHGANRQSEPPTYVNSPYATSPYGASPYTPVQSGLVHRPSYPPPGSMPPPAAPELPAALPAPARRFFRGRPVD